MAQVILVTAYADGTIFDPDGHNANMHTVAGGAGLFSEANGSLEAGAGGNLAAGFAVLAEHVRPAGVVAADRVVAARKMEFYSNGAYDSVGTERTFVQIGDCGFTFVSEFDESIVLLQWQFFIHQWRYLAYWNASGIDDNPVVILKAFLDGTALEYTRRPLASTAHLLDDTGGVPNHEYRNSESLAAQWWSMAAAVDSLGRGTHELSIRMFMDPGTSLVAINRTIGATAAAPYEHRCYNRATFGVRAAGGIAFHGLP